jgi:acyl-CoA synthetase (AMP-forming)/AMP-acid ligase II
MSSLGPIYDQLTAPGAPFALAMEEVLGETMPVFASRPGSLRALLEASRAHVDREFLVFGSRRISYREHREQVAQLARGLSEKYGIRPGDRVAILAANRPEWILTFWAVTSLGAIAVGMNGWWAAEEILNALEDCAPSLLVGDRRRLERIEGREIGVPIVEIESAFGSLYTEAHALPDHPIDEDDPACILYTSGTTGRAKGAVLSHRALVAGVGLQTLNGAATLLAHSSAIPTEPPCTLLTTPLFHVSGLVAGVVTMLATGAKVVLREGRFDPVDVMRLIEQEHVTSWPTTPTMAHRVVHHPELDDCDLTSLRHLGSGGSALGEHLQQRIRERLPDAARGIGLGYGLTESGGIATINSGEELAAHPTSAGRAMPSVEVEIRDPAGRRLPEDTEGEIYIRSPLVMLGYWRNEAATEEALAEGRWLRTGDIGRIQGGQLYIDSRARDLIIRGGENVYPVEVEHAIESHPAVDEAAVVGADHEELGQEVHAFVVPKAGSEIGVDELDDWVRGRLAAFKVPARWTLRQTRLPRNASGKLVKPSLAGATLAMIED